MREPSNRIRNIVTDELEIKRIEEERTKKLQQLAQTYTLPEIEAALGVSRYALMRYIKQGRLQASKFGGRWRVTAESLERFLKGKSD